MSEITNMQAVSAMEAVDGTYTHNFKEYTLRRLQARDVFLMSKIIGAIGIEQFKFAFSPEFMTSAAEGKDSKDLASSVGVEMFFEIAGIVLNGLPNCERDIYTFISNLTGMPVKDVETLPVDTFFNIIVDIVKKDEFRDFIGVVSKLLK